MSPSKNKSLKKADLKLVVETEFMTNSGDKGGIPVMSRAGKITSIGDPVFINKDRVIPTSSKHAFEKVPE
jgi:hypothetical protein